MKEIEAELGKVPHVCVCVWVCVCVCFCVIRTITRGNSFEGKHIYVCVCVYVCQDKAEYGRLDTARDGLDSRYRHLDNKYKEMLRLTSNQATEDDLDKSAKRCVCVRIEEVQSINPHVICVPLYI